MCGFLISSILTDEVNNYTCDFKDFMFRFELSNFYMSGFLA